MGAIITPPAGLLPAPVGPSVSEASSERRIYSVSELNYLIRDLLEQSLPRVWIEAELSNFRRPGAHWYFSLKDADAQLRCAMFRGNNVHVRPVPADGDQVLVRGKISLYGARGDMQLIVEHMEPAGEGALRREFERLKAQLQAEGLFDEALKRPLPALPQAIGVVTSATGAALQDILSTLQRRYRLADVYLYPSAVQGDEAAPALRKALQELPKLAPVEVIILARGGGSLEDLWPFNDEALARAIRACPVPVISGVGHEIDFSISDFAADHRAPTPTAAAELVAPAQSELWARVELLVQRMTQREQLRMTQGRQNLLGLERRLQRQAPERQLQRDQQRLDEQMERLQRSWSRHLQAARGTLHGWAERLRLQQPQRQLARDQQRWNLLHDRLRRAGRTLSQHQRGDWRALNAQLQGYSPTAPLQRGYALVRDADGRLLRDTTQTSPGAQLQIRLARGQLSAEVRDISED